MDEIHNEDDCKIGPDPRARRVAFFLLVAFGALQLTGLAWGLRWLFG